MNKSATATAVLVLADGSVFSGISIGAFSTTEPLYRVGEVVFNTAMTGYQEILTDPSYTSQIVCLTSPHIGNTGINLEDIESQAIHVSGLIIRSYPLMASNWRKTQNLDTYLQSHGIPAISEIDTRRLTNVIRTRGAQKGCIVIAKVGSEITQIVINTAIQKAIAWPGLVGKNLAIQVSTKTPYTFSSKTPQYQIIAYDFGIKHSILRRLAERGCSVLVVPSNTPAHEVCAKYPDGIILSNGPGDPSACHEIIQNIKILIESKIPILGVCLGHQLLALALGAKTVKMTHGHHGANHPVQNILTKQVFISSQNHGFAVDQGSLPDKLSATYLSLFDGSLQGLQHKTLPIYGFQGHPEAGPGPKEMSQLFDEFILAIKKSRASTSTLIQDKTEDRLETCQNV